MADLLTRLRAALGDRYRIDRELGAGGMATVYLAHDIKHERKVAVKVLRPALVLSLGPERFLREIATTANLHHPHILPLYDSGRTPVRKIVCTVRHEGFTRGPSAIPARSWRGRRPVVART